MIALDMAGANLAPARAMRKRLSGNCTLCSIRPASQRPLVFTGHSLGGLLVREYAREFPAEVAGVVLIDSSSPQQLDELPGERASYEQDKQDFGRRFSGKKCACGPAGSG